MSEAVPQRQPLRGLLAQVLGAAATALLAWMLPRAFHGMWPLALTQGCAAALVSYVLNQPRWWLPMHLLFMPAVVVALTLHLPSELYLAAFILFALVFWGTVKGDVPLFLSSREVMLAVAEITDDARARRFADLGAGVGSVAAPLAQHFPLLMVEAWESAPLPWAITRWRGHQLPNLTVRRQSFWDADLSQYDVVFAFLSPQPMPALGEKVLREMRPGCLFISSSFPVPNWKPETVYQVEDRRGTRLYCYRIRENQS